MIISLLNLVKIIYINCIIKFNIVLVFELMYDIKVIPFLKLFLNQENLIIIFRKNQYERWYNQILLFEKVIEIY